MITTEGKTYLKDVAFEGITQEPDWYIGIIKGTAIASVNDTLINHAWTEASITRFSVETSSIVLTEALALGGFFLCSSLDNSGVLIATKVLTVVKYLAPGELLISPTITF